MVEVIAPTTPISQLIDLASERVGGRVIAANDEFFAPKENLLKPGRGVFIEDKYTDHGKWMDGWETRRRREPGHDWCIVRLGLPGVIHGVTIDTNHFKGNHPSAAAVDAASLEGDPNPDEIARVHEQWREILPQSPLQGHFENSFVVNHELRCTHVRLRIFPDGGVARLRIQGEVKPDWAKLTATHDPIDLAAVQHGGTIIACSDMFFSHPLNLLMPGRASNMGDGWETKRRRGPGHDWVIIKLGQRASVSSIEVDTNHFKGNFPESCSIEGCDALESAAPAELASTSQTWFALLPRTKLQAHTRHFFEREIASINLCSHVRLSIFPDGGISRLRLFGLLNDAGVSSMTPALARLNAMQAEQAEAQFLRCCGSTHWAGRMVDQRPFAGVNELLEAADRTWMQLNRHDWLEALNHHPRIGGDLDRAKTSGSRDWARQEQAGVATAPDEMLRTLAAANRAYEHKFGHLFLICASGKSASEMLEQLQLRTQNDAATELRNAAENQRLITRMRLEKLLHS